jgi:hypothetical protein
LVLLIANGDVEIVTVGWMKLLRLASEDSLCVEAVGRVEALQ